MATETIGRAFQRDGKWWVPVKNCLSCTDDHLAEVRKEDGRVWYRCEKNHSLIYIRQERVRAPEKKVKSKATQKG